MASTLEIVGIVSALGVVAAGALYVGDLRSDVDGLETRVAKLEARPLAAGKINRGDICYKLMDELSKDSGDFGRRMAIERQIALIARGDRTAASCTLPAFGDLSREVVRAGGAVGWPRYWHDHSY